MIEERSKENDLVARVSALEAEVDASANAEGAGEGERRALETINAVSRRVGVLEDTSHAMERRQQRTERGVEDVRRAWDASDWTAFDDACRRAFARLAGD